MEERISNLEDRDLEIIQVGEWTKIFKKWRNPMRTIKLH